MDYKWFLFFVFFFIGLLLLLCSGLHTVWAIYQMLFYHTSKVYRDDLDKMNETEWERHYFKAVMIRGRVGLIFTIIMWYVGTMLGCFVAGWFLVRIVQKKNVYVSSFSFFFFSSYLSDL